MSAQDMQEAAGPGEDGQSAGLFPGRDWVVAGNAPDVLAALDAQRHLGTG